MEVYRGLDAIHGGFSASVVTLGNFDGVHLGHQEIFRRLKARASELKTQALVLTFDPHPVRVLRPAMSPDLITPLEEKLRLIAECGIDGVVLADFTKEFAAQHPGSFVDEVLCEKLSARYVIVGHDFTFGRGKEGTIDSLKEMGERKGFDVEVVEALVSEGEIVSSTRIRGLIAGGDVSAAAALLGRNYSIYGEVVKGDGRGRSLGFPTANIASHGELFPENGVYAVEIELEKKRMSGIANVGVRPTFGGGERTIEAHIFDFDGSLYGEVVRLDFVGRVRDEISFSGPEELSRQIRQDIVEAKNILKRESS